MVASMVATPLPSAVVCIDLLPIVFHYIHACIHLPYFIHCSLLFVVCRYFDGHMYTLEYYASRYFKKVVILYTHLAGVKNLLYNQQPINSNGTCAHTYQSR